MAVLGWIGPDLPDFFLLNSQFLILPCQPLSLFDHLNGQFAAFAVKKRKLSVGEIRRPFGQPPDAFPGPFARSWTPSAQAFVCVKLTRNPDDVAIACGILLPRFRAASRLGA
jgi:hypothetical protein